MAKDVTLSIDGRTATVPEGATILAAAKSLDIPIPTLCHYEGLDAFGSCFLCVVEVEGRRNPAPACSTAVAEGMVVRTGTENIRATRKLCLELLFSDHLGDCLAPCSMTCPAGTPIQQYLNAIGSGQDDLAIQIVKQALPIPGALGRVCPRPCESQCRRVALEEPLAICWLHRHAADVDAATGTTYVPPVGPDTGKRVAVVGAGPAGISAAYFLRQMGHAVTIFEAQEEPGGMLRWGIPAYRLPREEIRREFQAILDMGVTIRYRQALGTDFHLADLRRQGFDAVFLAVGAPRSSGMRIEGEGLPGVFGGIEFLARASRGEQVPVGRRVVVVGGGNTAIDAVRTARRLGADEVTLLYRRTRAEMPALAIEIREAEREGTRFRFLAAPLAIRQGESGLVLSCQQMQLGEPGPDGRRQPVPIAGETFDLPVDSVIAAIGQRIEGDMLLKEAVELDRRASAIAVNPATMQTASPWLFAGGDVVAKESDKIAVWAVGSGRLAAIAMDQYLRSQPVVGKPRTFQVAMGTTPQEVPAARYEGFTRAPRPQMPELPPDQRVTSFREVELGLTPAMAREEARRCLACGCGAASDCNLRVLAVEYGAQSSRFAGQIRDYTVDLSHPEIFLEPGKCINCGICVRLSQKLVGTELFGFVHRGFKTRVAPYYDQETDGTVTEALLKISVACPTGAIMSREELGKRHCACLSWKSPA
ncbi:MAG: FAD-dependent oxidoreductase [Candidatus Methylomirabilota bacterium]